MKIPVSVVVLSLNEEAGISETLSKLHEFDEVVVVDSNSTDKTVLISRQLGARVCSFSWDGAYPKKKQWSLDNCDLKYDWVLLLDADEYPSPELVQEVLLSVEIGIEPDVSAFDIDLEYRFGGRFLRHGHRVTKRSFLNRRKCRFPEVNDLDAPGIREVEGHYQPVCEGRVAKLKASLMHDDRDPVKTWFDRHNRYSDWEAHLRMHPETRSEIVSKRTFQGQLFDHVPVKPVAFFVYGYFFRLGFLDGRAGFDYHVAQAMYYWQIGVKTRELRSSRGVPES